MPPSQISSRSLLLIVSFILLAGISHIFSAPPSYHITPLNLNTATSFLLTSILPVTCGETATHCLVSFKFAPTPPDPGPDLDHYPTPPFVISSQSAFATTRQPFTNQPALSQPTSPTPRQSEPTRNSPPKSTFQRQDDPEPPKTSTITLTTLEAAQFYENMDKPDSSPVSYPPTSANTFEIADFQKDKIPVKTLLNLSLLFTFDPTTADLVEDSPLSFDVEFTLTNSDKSEEVESVTFTLLVPVFPTTGYPRTIVRVVRYSVNESPKLIQERQDFDHNFAVLDNSTPQQMMTQASTVLVRLPTMTWFNTILPAKVTTPPTHLVILFSGFLDIELLDKDERVDTLPSSCFLNNIAIGVTVQYDITSTKQNLLTIALDAHLQSLLFLTYDESIPVEERQGTTITFECDDNVRMYSKAPEPLNTDTTWISNQPYSATLSFQNEPHTYNPIAQTTSVIQLSAILSFPQTDDLIPPYTQVDVDEQLSYYDQDVVFCHTSLIHSSWLEFGLKDRVQFFLTQAKPSSSNYPVLEKRTIVEHSKSGPTTTQVSMYQVGPDPDSKVPLAAQSYTTGYQDLGEDNLNRQSRLNGLSLFYTIPLTEYAKPASLQLPSTPTKSLSQSLHELLTGTATTVWSSKNDFNSQTQTPTNTPQDGPIKPPRPAVAQCGLIYTQRFGTSSLQGLSAGSIKPQALPSSIPSLLDIIDHPSVASVKFIPTIAEVMYFNLTTTKRQIMWSITLQNYQLNKPDDLETQSVGGPNSTHNIKPHHLAVHFPTNAYQFERDYSTCYFTTGQRQVSVKGVNPQGFTSGATTMIIFELGDDNHPNYGDTVEISCPSTIMKPRESAYQFRSPTIPVRVVANFESADIGSNTVLIAPEAINAFLLLVFMLCVIGFFILLTVVLTRICNGLIDRLHRHKVHVIQYTGEQSPGYAQLEEPISPSPQQSLNQGQPGSVSSSPPQVVNDFEIPLNGGRYQQMH